MWHGGPSWTVLQYVLLQVEAIDLFDPSAAPSQAVTILKNAIAQEQAARSKRAKPGLGRTKQEVTREMLESFRAEYIKKHGHSRKWMDDAAWIFHISKNTVKNRMK